MSSASNHVPDALSRRIKDGIRVVTQRLHSKRHPTDRPAVDWSRSKRRSVFRYRSRQSLKLPYIPPELWGVIIQHACLFDYDPLDTSQELSFLESSSSTQLATHRAAMHVKLALSLVCKEWNALSRPFVYEFVWISRSVQAKLLARTLIMEFVQGEECSGKYLRRLHIETPALERCAPADLRTILDYSPQLFIFSDHHSVQRNLLAAVQDPRCSPEEILRLVTHPKIRRLSWTCYDDTPFELRMHPLETNLATRLEYLELSCCSPNFRSIIAESFAQPQSHGATIDMNVCLPSLRALKVSLDNNTFAALASWDMPKLTNLSVLSSDFSYTGAGFAAFFQAHGAKLRQLELGHSSALVEEHYLTTPQHVLQMQHASPRPIPLAEWCPDLRELICSADAEWHWQSPDWIAPHILLPAHPRVELIGIRDIDTRLREDPDVPGADTPYFPLFEQLSSLLRRDAFPSLRYVRDMSEESHRMRMVQPEERVNVFWCKVVRACRERAVWLEDCSGVNITQRNLQRAAALRKPTHSYMEAAFRSR
ncbi:uncharacterized protein C8Q71DRAFT_543092 [Rhodofomes roseus]|uniref:F-box domain-containing protein n=1 Tax=Rhodofomes roseus TaxID=34475 RepID=A0ABQ8KKS6_9APHY|nr:uncharacterized protein C8Q71DRAFT_543092 [Rhodofomes roseus]KAH9838715.1 hypothetical protein C8Q71DRAFT_543092 [Rhodofomes roseus]